MNINKFRIETKASRSSQTIKWQKYFVYNYVIFIFMILSVARPYNYKIHIYSYTHTQLVQLKYGHMQFAMKNRYKIFYWSAYVSQQERIWWKNSIFEKDVSWEKHLDLCAATFAWDRNENCLSLLLRLSMIPMGRLWNILRLQPHQLLQCNFICRRILLSKYHHLLDLKLRF